MEIEFKEWLMLEFKKYETKMGGRQNFVDFARFLKVKPPTLTRWLNGDSIPTGDSVYQLATRLGPEVYDVLGLPIPNYSLIEFMSVPPDLKDAMFSAFREIDSALSATAITLSPDEKNRLIDNIMAKYGFARTDKIKSGNNG
jgi:transcriptional regulator with XRE-family HTH domain